MTDNVQCVLKSKCSHRASNFSDNSLTGLILHPSENDDFMPAPGACRTPLPEL